MPKSPEKCIFCLKAVIEMSDEHVFPQAIGGTITIRSVCRDCNSRLGAQVDAPMCEDWLFKAQRHFLRLPGKSGKVPNIFEEGELLEAQGQKIRVKLDDLGAVDVIELVPRKSEDRDDGNLPGFTLSVDQMQEGQVPEMIEKIVAREGRRTGRKPTVETTSTRMTTENPCVAFPANIDLDAHRRGYLKIAYELGCRWLGPDYPDDPIASELRRAIWNVTPRRTPS